MPKRLRKFKGDAPDTIISQRHRSGFDNHETNFQLGTYVTRAAVVRSDDGILDKGYSGAAEVMWLEGAYQQLHSCLTGLPMQHFGNS